MNAQQQQVRSAAVPTKLSTRSLSSHFSRHVASSQIDGMQADARSQSRAGQPYPDRCGFRAEHLASLRRQILAYQHIQKRSPLPAELVRLPDLAWRLLQYLLLPSDCCRPEHALALMTTDK